MVKNDVHVCLNMMHLLNKKKDILGVSAINLVIQVAEKT